MNKCLNCGNDTNNPKYCNRSCSSTHTNKIKPKRKLVRKCKKCDNIVRNKDSILCEFHYVEYISSRYDKNKNLTLEDYWKKKSLENLHPSSKNAHIRSLGRTKFKELLKQPCANCSYDKHVELCHIKPIKKFKPTDYIELVNSEDNVIQLCPNCHWEFDNGLLDIKKN